MHKKKIQLGNEGTNFQIEPLFSETHYFFNQLDRNLEF